MKRIGILLSVICLSMTMLFSTVIVQAGSDGTYKVCLDITVVKNKFLARYDVEVYVDNEYIDTAAHGQNTKMFLLVPEGRHNIRFLKENSGYADGETEITVTEDSTISLKLVNHELFIEIKSIATRSGVSDDEQGSYIPLVTDHGTFAGKNEDPAAAAQSEQKGYEIDVEDPSIIRDVQQELNDWGFDCGTTNGVVGQQTTDAILTYQNAFGLNPDGKITNELLESFGLGFSQTLVSRAAVVAMTNYFDNSGSDVPTLHSYSDEPILGRDNRFYFQIVSWGDWTKYKNDRWHIEHLVLTKDSGEWILDVTLDVIYDGTCFAISDVRSNTDRYDSVGIDFFQDSAAFRVFPALVEKDRSKEGRQLVEIGE